MKPHAAHQIISTARSELIPKLPKSLNDLAQAIPNFPDELKMSCFGCFVSDDNKVGVVFSSQKLMNTIGHYETTELYIDGTFDVSKNMVYF